ncbi:MAG: hypothetical protein ACI841_003904 [Planctomycetota bacterium]
MSKNIHAVDHEGHVFAVTYWLLEATALGLYELTFEGIGAERFLPTLVRRAEVRAGETTEVIVDLLRKQAEARQSLTSTIDTSKGRDALTATRVAPSDVEVPFHRRFGMASWPVPHFYAYRVGNP